ncbi:MAG TPA: FIST N-terminal domain-containing protein [Dehalococcoidia bacterium]|nr:FIST N-terminal domain-containing protein [Dehalococcoidia bacterium]
MRAEAAIGIGPTWQDAFEEARAALPMLRDGVRADLALLFASDAYGDGLSDLVKAVRQASGAGVLIGCSGQGVIGPAREVEDRPAIALQVFSLPGAMLKPVRLSPTDLEGSAAWQEEVATAGREASAFITFVDPFTVDGERLLSSLTDCLGQVPLVGGLASGSFARGRTYLFLNDDVFADGAVGLALGGAYTVRTVVSQGCEPIGETWTITGAHGNVIETIGMRPALDVLIETFEALPAEMQERARRNLLVGLAMNEYRDEFRRGDFLVRNLLGIDQQSGAIAVGALPRVGQTLQFQVRDPDAADEDLRQMLALTKSELGGQAPVGALLCSCNGRGMGLFGVPDHDAKVLADLIGPVPVAGFFCNGEIGPVDGKNFLHGFTASVALILPIRPSL